MKITSNNVSLNYEVDGPEGAPWMTFSNSLAADLSIWDPQVNHFRDKYRILRYDTRGHGKSEPISGAYTLDMLANDVLGLWNALGINKSHFIGLSLGGMTAQSLALQYPERMHSIAICDSRADCPEGYRSNWHQRIPEVEKNGMEPLVEPTLQRWFTNGCRSAEPEMMDRVRAMIRSTSSFGYIGCAQAILGLDYLSKLKAITLPAIFIVGAQDGGTPPEAAQAMHKEVAGSQYVEIDPAAHVSNMENPVAFNKTLDDFLSGLNK